MAWFKSWGWIYRPVSIAAWLALLLTLAFCVNVFLAVDRHSHSASDTLYGIFPFVLPALMMLNWLASKTSKAGVRGEGLEKDSCVLCFSAPSAILF